MEIELRNQLGALTGQVQELIKQSKNLDSTLAGALDKGSKSAGGMAENTRRARSEMTLVEEVSHKMGRAWASQMLSLATGAVGVTALWQTVAAAMDRAEAKTAENAKSSVEFTRGTRIPGVGGAELTKIRSAIRATAPSLDVTSGEQAAVLKSYVTARGKPSEQDVSRLGAIVNIADLMGFDRTALAGQYGKLQKLGVSNPEDVIMGMTNAGDQENISKLTAGSARAMGQKYAGSWKTAEIDTRKNASPSDKLEWSNRNLKSLAAAAGISNSGMMDENKKLAEAAIAAGVPADQVALYQVGAESMASGSILGVMSAQERFQKRAEVLRKKVQPLGINLPVGPNYGAGPFGYLPPNVSLLNAMKQAYPGKTNAEIEAEIDAGIMPPEMQPQSQEPSTSQPIPQPIVRPAPWASTVSKRPEYIAPRAPVAEVRIVGDARPMPINVGD